MNKIVPDPPALPANILQTAPTPFGIYHATEEPMFMVRGGIDGMEALEHVSFLLKCATQSAYETCDNSAVPAKGLLWSTIHSIEAAHAMVEALLSGVGKPAAREKP